MCTLTLEECSANNTPLIHSLHWLTAQGRPPTLPATTAEIRNLFTLSVHCPYGATTAFPSPRTGRTLLLCRTVTASYRLHLLRWRVQHSLFFLLASTETVDYQRGHGVRTWRKTAAAAAAATTTILSTVPRWKQFAFCSSPFLCRSSSEWRLAR